MPTGIPSMLTHIHLDQNTSSGILRVVETQNTSSGITQYSRTFPKKKSLTRFLFSAKVFSMALVLFPLSLSIAYANREEKKKKKSLKS